MRVQNIATITCPSIFLCDIFPHFSIKDSKVEKICKCERSGLFQMNIMGKILPVHFNESLLLKDEYMVTKTYHNQGKFKVENSSFEIL